MELAAPPRMQVTPLPGHRVISSVIELPDRGFSCVVMRPEFEACFVGDRLDRDQRVRLETIGGELELYRLLKHTLRDDASWDPLLDNLITTRTGRLFVTRHQEAIELAALTPAELCDLDGRLCRDSDCHDGAHIWWQVPFTPDPNAGSYIWHINTDGGGVVPPSPLYLLPA